VNSAENPRRVRVSALRHTQYPKPFRLYRTHKPNRRRRPHEPQEPPLRYCRQSPSKLRRPQFRNELCPPPRYRPDACIQFVRLTTIQPNSIQRYFNDACSVARPSVPFQSVRKSLVRQHLPVTKRWKPGPDMKISITRTRRAVVAAYREARNSGRVLS
jgi:hypothetical protein